MKWKRLTFVLSILLSVGTLHAQSGGALSHAEITRRLVIAAVDRSHVHVRYVPDYVRIPYPGGDVPADTGVCTDEIIRIYRIIGVDLQKEVHEDMVQHFDLYPSRLRWMRRGPDSNIDHRRVPNLIVFFGRKGEVLPASRNATDYKPGDIVTWNLGNGQTHIGMVVDQKGLLSNRFKVLHNIGRGPEIEDVLFDWQVTGHFRYYGPK